MNGSDSSGGSDAELSDTEQDIVEFIEVNGNSTPAYIASELDFTKEYVRGLLRDLERMGYVERLHRGLYAVE
jgi:uncharacterized membrane protein